MQQIQQIHTAIKSLSFTPLSRINKFVFDSSGKIDLVMSVNAWESLPFTAGTLIFLESARTGDSGMSYHWSIAAKFAGEEIPYFSAISVYRNIPLIALVIDMDGKTRVVGTPEAPIYFQHNHGSSMGNELLQKQVSATRSREFMGAIPE